MRSLILAIVAIAFGGAIDLLDSRPTWDDTGITAFAVLTLGFVVALLAGSRPWLWAILVGAWIPAFALVGGRGPAALLALVFATVGSYAGWAASRAWSGRPPRPSMD